MEHKIVLLAGEMNDANRDYLPEAIKGSRMTVNENGNNSQVYPANLKEYSADVVGDGVSDTWYEYVPKSYNPAAKTPLVFSMHGGLMTGWGQCVYTGWSHVADKEGFICVFPNASAKRMWMIESDPDKIDEICAPGPDGVPALNVPTGTVPQFHDVKMVMALLERMKSRYNIDAGRVYIQGMSMGNCMTSQVARYHGDSFAGAAGSGCPTNPKLLFDKDDNVINAGGALDIWQSRMEHDFTPPHYGAGDREVVIANIDYWRRINDAMCAPEISIRGDKNLFYYRGKKGNMMLMDVYNRDHGQTVDDAQLVWDYMFSGAYRDENGTLCHAETRREFKKDACALALADGAENALLNGEVVPLGGRAFCREILKYHGQNGGQIVRGKYIYAPVAFLAKAFDGEVISDGQTAEIRLKDGRVLTFAHSYIGCTADNTLEAMYAEAVTVGEKLYIPAQWFCDMLLNLRTSTYGTVLYATDHTAHVSRYAQWIIEDMLRG